MAAITPDQEATLQADIQAIVTDQQNYDTASKAVTDAQAAVDAAGTQLTNEQQALATAQANATAALQQQVTDLMKLASDTQAILAVVNPPVAQAMQKHFSKMKSH